MNLDEFLEKSALLGAGLQSSGAQGLDQITQPFPLAALRFSILQLPSQTGTSQASSSSGRGCRQSCENCVSGKQLEPVGQTRIRCSEMIGGPLRDSLMASNFTPSDKMI